MKTAFFRFYEELNDFLPEEKWKIEFPHHFQFRVSVKDMIESIGIPHTEVDLILVNGNSVDFNYIVEDKDKISVYPVYESFDITPVQHLRAKPLREPKFVLDVHLGTLARYMRMIGLDAEYRNDFDDESLVKISLNEKRTILTKDLGILKRKEVTHGYFIRNINPEEQLKEVVNRFHLQNEIKEFSRCLECNSRLERIEKSFIENKLPGKIKILHNEFFFCSKCDKVYWEGTHVKKMREIIHNLNK